MQPLQQIASALRTPTESDNQVNSHDRSSPRYLSPIPRVRHVEPVAKNSHVLQGPPCYFIMCLYLRCSGIKLCEVIQSHAHTGLAVVLYNPINVRSSRCLRPPRISVRTDCNCSSRPRAQPYIAPRLTRGRPTSNGNLVVAELRRWVSSQISFVDFVRRFDFPSHTQFATVDVDALPRLLFMLFSVAVLTVTGLFPDVGGLIIFCPLFPFMFAFVSFTPVTYVTSSHNGYGIFILFPGSFPSLSSVLTLWCFSSFFSILYLC